MIPTKLWGLADLVRAQTFYIYKMIEVVIIGKYKYFVLAIFEIVAPYFEHLSNGQNHNIVSFISSFGWNYFMQIISHYVPLAQII